MLEKTDKVPELEKREKPLVFPEVKKAPKAETPGLQRILVKRFLFEGNTIFSENELRAVVSEAEGRELSLEDLKGVSDLITAKYRDAGYLIVNAFVPAQSIADGKVLIKVVEGRVGDIIVTGNRSYSSSFVKRYLNGVRKDPTLKEETLEKKLLLLNEYPSLTVAASLKAGKEPGTTDLIASVNDRFPISGSISYDNFGVKSTSRERAVASLDVGNLVTSGDLLMLRGILGLDTIDIDKLSYGRVEYMVPVGSLGTQIGAYYTNAIYAAGGITLSQMDIHGKARVAGVYVSHPFIKDRNEGLSVRFGGEYSSVKDYLLGGLQDKDEIRKLALNLAYDVTDRYLGRNFIGFGYFRGLGDFWDGSGPGSTGVSRVGANNSFDKFTLDLMRIQKLPGYNHLILRASGQYSPDRLFLAEQYILGGEGTIRGFNPSILSGDSGYFLSAEFVTSPIFPDEQIFGQKVGDTIKFAFFGDYGAAYNNNEVPGEKHYDYLGSLGAGVRLYAGKYFSSKLDWAVPSIDGDFDTSKSMFWFQAMFAF